jgi:hypothetical protein
LSFFGLGLIFPRWNVNSNETWKNIMGAMTPIEEPKKMQPIFEFFMFFKNCVNYVTSLNFLTYIFLYCSMETFGIVWI